MKKSYPNSLRHFLNFGKKKLFCLLKRKCFSGRSQYTRRLWNGPQSYVYQDLTNLFYSTQRGRCGKLSLSEKSVFNLKERNISTSILPLIRSENDPILGKGNFLEIEDYAKIDYNRAKRTGLPEAIFGEGKTADQILGIFSGIKKKQNEAKQVAKTGVETPSAVIGTRISEEKYNKMQELIIGEPNKYGILAHQLHYFPTPGIVFLKASSASISVESNSVSIRDLVGRSKESPDIGAIAVLSAGTSDLPMAEEAAIFAEASGCHVYRVHDVGVAGLHRLLNSLPKIIDKVSVIICVAGMDGALPTVVSGLVEAPVIALPTSVGYGVTFSGITPLLTMLNGCAPGMAVVNIDNGFGAAAMAVKIIKSKDIVKK